MDHLDEKSQKVPKNSRTIPNCVSEYRRIINNRKRLAKNVKRNAERASYIGTHTEGQTETKGERVLWICELSNLQLDARMGSIRQSNEYQCQFRLFPTTFSHFQMYSVFPEYQQLQLSNYRTSVAHSTSIRE